MKITYMTLAALLFAAAVIVAPTYKTSAKGEKFRTSDRPIAGQYIVVLNESLYAGKLDPAASAEQLAKEYPASIKTVYESSIKGYAAKMDPGTAQLLSDDPRVKYVEEDGEVEAQATQINATWGISRIDQAAFTYPLDTNYNYSATGSGVKAYIIDSGILTTHPDFQGRAIDAFDAYHDNTPMSQCNGHGTHVAGTVGSATYGVAKSVTLYSVKVFPCWGNATVSDVISGIDWVSRHYTLPAVANMSLGGSYSSSMNDAIRGSVALGITYVVAAGNWNDDACNYSPSSVAEVISVGSTDQRDYRDSISDYGACVDIFAPGVQIISTWNQLPDYPTFNMGGTSAASPHVAGIAALYLERNPQATPAQVATAITDNATPNILSNIGTGSPNLFAYSSFIDRWIDPPCFGADFFGSIVSTGGTEYQSSSNGFAARSGRFKGALTVPAGAAFQLVLEGKRGSRWTSVASSPGGGGTQNIDVSGKSGTYRWRVASMTGTGDYSLCSTTP